MNAYVKGLLGAALVVSAGCTGVNPAHPAGERSREGAAVASKAKRGLPAFESEQALESLLERWAAQAEKQERELRARYSDAMQSSTPMPPAPSAAEPAASESITNVQTAGVDEGGIVKRHGEHLVVLRRGRLFTVRIGDDRLQRVSTVDAFGPGVDPSGAWYDEMLVAGDTVVVIGFSYSRGGTELVRFRIDDQGTLSYRDTWHLRSNDYYSSRNYASRLIGTTLVLYTPLYINASNIKARDFMPAVRRWTDDARPADFRRLLPATRLFRADDDLDSFAGVALHTVVRCDLATDDLDCAAVAVLGPPGRVFYVSADSVFVWTTQHAGTATNRSTVVRIPLDDGTPTALQTRGVPIDQLSFLHGSDGHLNVMLTQVGAGEGMWGEATQSGDLALLRVDLDSFGDGQGEAEPGAYRRLPFHAEGNMQNRFIGDWLIYGNAPYPWARGAESKAMGAAFALRFAGTGAVQALAVGHGVERIEALGQNAILVGSAKADLQFSSVRLGDSEAVVAGAFVQPEAAQGESRTHGFFYKDEGNATGVVGLPVIARQRSSRMQGYLSDSAAVIFLHNHDLQLSPLGELAADIDTAVNDQCRASCVDWYGNARPIFVGDRVFALLGYELVEGRIVEGRMTERRRLNFAPTAVIAR